MAKFEYKKPASDLNPFTAPAPSGSTSSVVELDHRSEPVVLPGNELDDDARVSGP
jgi:hypothetical protein